MLSPNQIKQSFYPGEEWVYMKLYMGPETAEEWICYHLPRIMDSVQKDIPGAILFFIRFLDPDFHVRVRVYIPHRKHFSVVVNLINQHSGIMIRQGVMWKTEICTYEREVERYSVERIELFERAFSIDSDFWLRVLPLIEAQDNREDLRWKMALLSTYRYYRDLIRDPEEIIRIMSKIVQALKQEQKPGRTLMYQIDQKFRMIRGDLMPFLEDELSLFPQVEVLLRKRSLKLTELFDLYREGDCYFTWSKSDQNIADLVHMSLNRVLRSKHRMQEFVIYYYLVKLMKTQLALR
ncbi:MAG: thiopeptide-type bacteriocin biosynthesis protein [Bacteroidales bacterium]|nr:thiopeptide-type bacteriocin biosynthesis protein [Bacteroidales bacterium]